MVEITIIVNKCAPCVRYRRRGVAKHSIFNEQKLLKMFGPMNKGPVFEPDNREITQLTNNSF